MAKNSWNRNRDLVKKTINYPFLPITRLNLFFPSLFVLSLQLSRTLAELLFLSPSPLPNLSFLLSLILILWVVLIFSSAALCICRHWAKGSSCGVLAWVLWFCSTFSLSSVKNPQKEKVSILPTRWRLSLVLYPPHQVFFSLFFIYLCFCVPFWYMGCFICLFWLCSA